ncbi:PhnD/SsuA/transferrin family substrate-binding protein [Aromatoleum bremense]|uniref:PhnD/SsuA/transferrin family substrate-binding protein n=1 Tax=Aromatoleum bremense TaxID=76115 RepID=A0ABX1NR45_9RHOO|nr:PhnD/SsuA/transferrin family substrate-binding protein [Aromatoleum bremense]NMG14161.1 PhnD/SsuA/transferrin family substrate-binding protein [Aromatoleum bremense]
MDRDVALLEACGRRAFLRGVGALAALTVLPAHGADIPVRIGLTPVFLDDQMSFLSQWRRWLEVKLGSTVVFVQRGSYREVMDLLRAGKLDFAWVCGYPYVRHRQELKLVAVPLWRGGPYYQSYLIVPAEDTRTTTLAGLRGKVFAYSDPDSNSGYLYPRYLLTTQGENPDNFFSRSFFTWAHRKVVEAVGIALAEGGAVDGYVWETLAELHPDLTRTTRVIERSPPLGYPPFVARSDIPTVELARFRAVLLGMTADPEGMDLLQRLRLDGFIPGEPELFDEIARMAARVKNP